MTRLVFASALLLLVAFVTGCNVETMGTAATGAALKKQELEQGRQTMRQTQQRIDTAVQQMNQAAQRAGDEKVN
jgi:hypothetical protein